MRKILFRGKRISNGSWVYGGIMQTFHPNYDHSSVDAFFKQTPNCYCICTDGKDIFVDQESIGQFTGLNDRNGKKIFEGDKCRVSRPGVLAYGKITFQHGCFWFVDDGPGGMLRLCDVNMNGFVIEVVGNIYD